MKRISNISKRVALFVMMFAMLTAVILMGTLLTGADTLFLSCRSTA